MAKGNLNLLAAVGVIASAITGVNAARNHSDIRQFDIWPAIGLPKGVTFDTLGKYCQDEDKKNNSSDTGSSNIGTFSGKKSRDVCYYQRSGSERDFKMFNDDCKDGTFCPNSGCGHWAGKDKMCCTGTPEGRWNPTNETWLANAFRTACTPYKDTLKDYKLSDGKKPETTGCEFPDLDDNGSFVATEKNYPVNYTYTGPGTLSFENGKPQCCSTDGDSISVFAEEKDFAGNASQVVCIPPVIKSKSTTSAGVTPFAVSAFTALAAGLLTSVLTFM